MLFEATDNELYNNGSVQNVDIWNWQDINLGTVKKGDQIKFTSEFDRFHGVVGIDNIRVYSNQK